VRWQIMTERFAVAEESPYESYVVDTVLDANVAGPFRYVEQAVRVARTLEQEEKENAE